MGFKSFNRFATFKTFKPLKQFRDRFEPTEFFERPTISGIDPLSIPIR
jgi:hypothetical protein